MYTNITTIHYFWMIQQTLLIHGLLYHSIGSLFTHGHLHAGRLRNILACLPQKQPQHSTWVTQCISTMPFRIFRTYWEVLMERKISTVVVRCHYHKHKSVIHPIMKNEGKIRGNFKASAPLNTNISCWSLCDPFLDKLKGLLCMVQRWRWKLSCHHTRCTETCRRRHSNWSPHLFLSSPPPYTVCHFITLTTFSKEHVILTKTNVFLLSNH